MATRDVTPQTLALADLFRRHRERALDGMTKKDASERAGFKDDSTYRNIEAGREVSLATYRQAARKLGLPGGEDRVEAIFNGQPDPGPGASVLHSSAFHPSANGAPASQAQLAEITSRVEQLFAVVVERLDLQGTHIDALTERVQNLENPAPSTPKPARKTSSR